MAITYDGTVLADSDLDIEDLEITKINEQDTLKTAIEKINANFKNIAQHGGGPSGKDGNDGVDGIDGVDGGSAEYIYFPTSLAELEALVHYPSDSSKKCELFDNIKKSSTGSWTYNDFTWYDHPQGVTAAQNNEFMLMRFRRQDDNGVCTPWIYTDVTLWSHWGSKGTDGDGVEYIFCQSTTKPTTLKYSNL